METAPPTARALIQALATHDFQALTAALEPTVTFRALVPGELVDVRGAAETVACFRRWFGDKTDIAITDEHAEMLIDRLVIRFRAQLRKDGQPYVVEQTLCGDIDNGRFSTLDMVCSGFRPAGVAAGESSIHLFDAGDLGCGTGLPREFRTRIAQIPVGHVLDVVTGDASAREDLPSLARLLGHRVLAVEPGADGRISIRVERVK